VIPAVLFLLCFHMHHSSLLPCRRFSLCVLLDNNALPPSSVLAPPPHLPLLRTCPPSAFAPPPTPPLSSATILMTLWTRTQWRTGSFDSEVTSLDISNNKLGGEGAKIIAGAIKVPVYSVWCIAYSV
jgi:hypothetical protein